MRWGLTSLRIFRRASYTLLPILTWQIRPVDYRRMQADLNSQNQQARDARSSKNVN